MQRLQHIFYEQRNFVLLLRYCKRHKNSGYNTVKIQKSRSHKLTGYEKPINKSDKKPECSDSSDHTFEKIIYKNIYNDIDIIFYNKDFMINCDFILNPFCDPRNITMEFIEYCNLSIDEFGNLVIHMPLEREIIIRKPIAYQEIDSHIINVECNYKLRNKHVHFSLGKYNKKYKLIINPNVR